MIDLKSEKTNYMINDNTYIYQKSLQLLNKNKNSSNFVFFLMHGLEACPFNMRIIKATIIYYLPNSYVFLINNIQNQTNKSINLQSKQFSDEVQFILNTSDIPGNHH